MFCTKGRRRFHRRGATIVMLSLMLPVVLAVAAYAINVVYMELARTELQITTDLATRAAGRVLAVTGDKDQAITAAERLMKANPFVNETLSLKGTDIVFGVCTRYAESERYAFNPGDSPNAVQVRANGKVSIPMLFPTMGVPIEFRPIKTAISTQSVLDIALVIDRSGSMAYSAAEVADSRRNPAAAPAGWGFGKPIPPQARWLDAINAVDSFLELLSESRHDEQVSLNTYSDKQAGEVALTSNYAAIENALLAHSAKFNGGATNIGDGILGGASSLSDKRKARSWASRVMIVLTDGIHNTGTDPLVAAQIAASQNIIIYTITFSAEADEAKMQQVAATASGKHFHATSSRELVNAFEEIAHSLPTLITY